jgi:hypothetical protein
MTITTIESDFFEGQSNLTEGSSNDPNARHLASLIREIVTQCNLNETKIDRSSDHPEITGIRPAAGSALKADGSENVTILGTNLIQGQTFASYTLGASLEIIAEVPGAEGNGYSVEVVDSGGGGLAVTFAADKLSIDLGGATPTEDQIATAVNTAGTWTGILRANSGGGAAFGTVGERSLIGGGSTSGVTVMVGGVDCPPAGATGAGATSTASFSETALIVNPSALTGATPALAANDMAAARVESNGKFSQSISILLEA